MTTGCRVLHGSPTAAGIRRSRSENGLPSTLELEVRVVLSEEVGSESPRDARERQEIRTEGVASAGIRSGARRGGPGRARPGTSLRRSLSYEDGRISAPIRPHRSSDVLRLPEPSLPLAGPLFVYFLELLLRM